MDPNFNEKIKIFEKEVIKNDDLMKDDRARTMVMNRISIKEDRNFSAQRAVKKLEKDLMKILIWAYPTKALEVKNIFAWPAIVIKKFLIYLIEL